MFTELSRLVNSGSKRWQKIGREETTLFYGVYIVFLDTESLEEISGTRDRHLFDDRYRQRNCYTFLGFLLGKVVINSDEACDKLTRANFSFLLLLGPLQQLVVTHLLSLFFFG